MLVPLIKERHEMGGMRQLHLLYHLVLGTQRLGYLGDETGACLNGKVALIRYC